MPPALRITVILATSLVLSLSTSGCPESTDGACFPKAGECPNVCAPGTGVLGEACDGTDDCGCGMACLGFECALYTGAHAGCSCAPSPPDASGDVSIDAPKADGGPDGSGVTQPWDENCADKVLGASCNPYCQVGCDAADRHCTLSAGQFECRAFGATPIGGECADSTACQEGMSCFMVDGQPVGTCHKPCILESDCPGDRPCNTNVTFPDFTAKFCGTAAVGCDPFADPATACGTGNGCYLGGQATQCMPAGSDPAGTDCYGQGVNTCQAGLQCVVECQQACSTDDAGSATPKCSTLCAGGEVEVINADNKLGVCLTATVPATCDIWAQTGCAGGESCYRVAGGVACVTTGGTALGGACTSSTNCVPGGVCVGSKCEQLCDPSADAATATSCGTLCLSPGDITNLTPTAWEMAICTSLAP